MQHARFLIYDNQNRIHFLSFFNRYQNVNKRDKDSLSSRGGGKAFSYQDKNNKQIPFIRTNRDKFVFCCLTGSHSRGGREKNTITSLYSPSLLPPPTTPTTNGVVPPIL